MSESIYAVGQILVNDLRQFTKIISLKNGVYGLSGWTSKENAEKATVAHKFVNVYGLKYANLRVVSAGPKVKATAPAETSGSKAKETTPKNVVTKAKGKAKAKK